MATLQTDIRSALHIIAYSSITVARSLSSSPRSSAALPLRRSSLYSTSSKFHLRAFCTGESSTDSLVKKSQDDKPSICTADELHYVTVPNSDWRLALWRYNPPPQAPVRNHPLLLLSGVGTNAIGYDLSPGSSFARFMSSQGFDTWILEVRGAGLSVQASSPKELKQSAKEKSDQMEAAKQSAGATSGASLSAKQQPNGHSALMNAEAPAVEVDPAVIATAWDESKLVSKLTETFMLLSERLSGFLSEGQQRIISANLFDRISKLLEDSQLSEAFYEIREKLSTLLESRENSGITNQIRELSLKLVNIVEEGQRSVSPPLFDLQERFFSTIEDFQKQLDLIVKYDWDFDNYLEEDIPAVMEYIIVHCKPGDGKLLAIGHSMGGILLYAMLSKYGFEGRDPRLAAVVTLASSLDYTSSKSTLKLLLPLADPAQALNVPVVPLGALLSAAYPLSSRPPYVLSWLNELISAQDMMHPEMLEKLVLNNFCTIPAKLILQLTTAFREGGLSDRRGQFFYKDHLHKSNLPVLALAGDRDLICPPEAVEETVKLIPEHLVTYKIFGEPEGPHYAHYDLVGGRLAVEQIYPCIVEFLSCHDVRTDS